MSALRPALDIKRWRAAFAGSTAAFAIDHREIPHSLGRPTRHRSAGGRSFVAKLFPSGHRKAAEVAAQVIGAGRNRGACRAASRSEAFSTHCGALRTRAAGCCVRLRALQDNKDSGRENDQRREDDPAPGPAVWQQFQPSDSSHARKDTN